jgi:excisionase family DNA binding protein
MDEPLVLPFPHELLEKIAQRAAEIAIAHEPAAPLDRPSPYMTVQEAADYLRAKPQRVYDLLSARRLTRHKDGSRVLISRDELDTHLGATPRKACRLNLGLREAPRGPRISGDNEMPRRGANRPGPA